MLPGREAFPVHYAAGDPPLKRTTGGAAYLDQPASVVASTRIPGPIEELSATFCT